MTSDKSFPQGLFQNHDNVLVSSLRKKETNMCVYVHVWMYFLQVGDKEQDVVIAEQMNTESYGSQSQALRCMLSLIAKEC